MICFLEPVSKDFQEKESPPVGGQDSEHGTMVTEAQIQAGVRRKKGHSSKECRRGGGERRKACFPATKEGWMQLPGENRQG